MTIDQVLNCINDQTHHNNTRKNTALARGLWSKANDLDQRNEELGLLKRAIVNQVEKEHEEELTQQNTRHAGASNV